MTKAEKAKITSLEAEVARLRNDLASLRDCCSRHTHGLVAVPGIVYAAPIYYTPVYYYRRIA